MAANALTPPRNPLTANSTSGPVTTPPTPVPGGVAPGQPPSVMDYPSQSPTGGPGGYGSQSDLMGMSAGTNFGSGGLGGGAQGGANVNGRDAVNVNIDPNILGSFQNYQDTAFNALNARMRPQLDRRRAELDQQAVNRGLQPGTPAYAAMMELFGQQENDATTQMAAQSIGVGLGAQNQAFGQGLSQSQLANELLRARESNSTNMQISSNNAAGARYNADLSRQNFLDNLGFERDQFGEGTRRNNRDFGEDQYRFDQGFGLQQGDQDMRALQALFGASYGTNQYNNQLRNDDFQRASGLFGLSPNYNPQTPDVMGAYGLNWQGQQQNYNQQNANRNGMMGGLGQLGGSLLGAAGAAGGFGALFACDKNIKDVTGDADVSKCLDIVNSLPLVHYTYKADETQRPYIQTFAQDFNLALHGYEDTTISVQDMTGVLLGAVQALSAKVAELESARG